MFTSKRLLGLFLVCSTFGIMAQQKETETKTSQINIVMSEKSQKVLGVGLGVCSAYILYTALFQVCLGSACGYASYWLLTNDFPSKKVVKKNNCIV